MRSNNNHCFVICLIPGDRLSVIEFTYASQRQRRLFTVQYIELILSNQTLCDEFGCWYHNSVKSIVLNREESRKLNKIIRAKKKSKHMKVPTMKGEKMGHNNPAFRNSTVTLGMPQEPRESYLSSNEFICKSKRKKYHRLVSCHLIHVTAVTATHRFSLRWNDSILHYFYQIYLTLGTSLSFVEWAQRQWNNDELMPADAYDINTCHPFTNHRPHFLFGTYFSYSNRIYCTFLHTIPNVLRYSHEDYCRTASWLALNRCELNFTTAT